MKFGTLYAYWTTDWVGDYSHFARKAATIGFDVLEISAGSLVRMSDKEIDELKAVAKDANIEITSNIGPPKDKDVASADPGVRRAGIDFLTGIMKGMHRLGSRQLIGVLHTFWPNDFADLDKKAVWSRGVESMKTLSKTAGDLGITLGVEVVNRFESHILNTASEAVQFCRDVNHPACKILLDTFHMNIEEDDSAEAIRTAGPLLTQLHVGEGNRKPPGQGAQIPWKKIGDALHEIAFDGYVVMEPFVKMGGQVGKDIKVWRDLSGGADEAALDANIKKSLGFLKDAFAR
jgi:D-psicose/D-tagatose/L-ribulose 3-epimerase